MTLLPRGITFNAFGDSIQFRATVTDTDGAKVEEAAVTWTISDTDVAVVDSDGRVTAIANGTATIRATVGGVTGEGSVEVRQSPSSIEVTTPRPELSPGDTLRASYTLLDANGFEVEEWPYEVTWRTFDPLVAEVDSTGLLRSVGTRLGTFEVIAESVSLEGRLTVAVTTAFTDVSAGWSSTCALTDQGRAYCWGARTLGTADALSETRPRAVDTEERFESVSVHHDHACATTASGSLYCWGNNTYGALGNGGLVPSDTPQAVSEGTSFASVAAGYAHTCAVTAAGRGLCWGYNAAGMLGDSSYVNRTEPTPVAGDLTFASIDPSSSRTCALDVDGKAYCWGSDYRSALGTTDLPLGETCGSSIESPCSSIPVAVDGDRTYLGLSTAPLHACAVMADGATYCWGYNAWGQLGDGTTETRAVPVPLASPLTFASLALGGDYSCGIASSGDAYCWGSNQFGQLGDGSTVDRASPTRVAVDTPFAKLAASRSHACGLTVEGSLYCWGDGERLSDKLGTEAGGLDPMKVVGSR